MKIDVDFLECHDDSKDFLALRKVVDCTVNTSFASSSGWGDLVKIETYGMPTDASHGGMPACVDDGCPVHFLHAYDLHLRSVETRLRLHESVPRTKQ